MQRGTRTSITAAEASTRIIKHRKSTKTWMQDTGRTQLEAKGDATERDNIDPEEAMQIVACTTRFATFMCVIIAFVKVGVYLKSGAAVVKTSALDSMGDLIANCITLYTGYRMANVNMKAFPIGQHRFEPLGVLIFSVLMAAMMFGNALSNVEDLVGEHEKEREIAVGEFWTALFGIKVKKEGGAPAWETPDPGFMAFKAVMGNVENCSDLLKTALAKGSFANATTAIQDTIDLVAEVKPDTLIREKLFFQNTFLGCCATYKFCLWMYCIFYALPKTGSQVLIALANDKRNDFVATTFVICCTFLGYFFEDEINGIVDDGADKVDPLCSLLLSSVIIYTWVCLALEQIQNLNMRAVEPEIHEAVTATVKEAIKNDNMTFGFDLKAYYSSNKYTAEVDLNVYSPDIPFTQVQNTMGIIQQSITASDEVERVIVVPTLG